MKSKVHPKYYHNTQVTCACGHQFITGSILPAIQIEICGACHPFFTGQEKLVDTEGRVQRFTRKRDLAQSAAVAAVQRLKKKKGAKEVPPARPKTLREMLEANR